eukprot:6462629-Amphidinium_carterae.1
MGHDLILMQETFLLQLWIAGAVRQASELGYFSSFIPARGTAGRPSGGLATSAGSGQDFYLHEHVKIYIYNRSDIYIYVLARIRSGFTSTTGQDIHLQPQDLHLQQVRIYIHMPLFIST